MTVIAWDGKTLAADKRETQAGLITTTTKIFRIGAGHEPCEELAGPCRVGDRLIGFAGAAGSGYPIIVEEERFATGSGRDYALAAMHLGLDAKSAVDVACRFDNGCGNGVDTLTFVEG